MRTETKVNILGVEYTIIKGVKSDEDEHLKDCDGYTDTTSKEIIINEISKENGYEWKNAKYHEDSIVRHEIVHAFLYECGLSHNGHAQWAKDEEIVDWISKQHSKLHSIFEELNTL